MEWTRLQLDLSMIAAYLRHEDGQDMVEYGLVIGLIAFGTLTGLASVSTDISMIYSAISSTIIGSLGS